MNYTFLPLSQLPFPEETLTSITGVTDVLRGEGGY